MSKPKIGLVGGLGPLSTVDYYIGIMISTTEVHIDAIYTKYVTSL